MLVVHHVGVVAHAADQGVCTLATIQHVVAFLALHAVGGGVAHQVVVPGRADEVFNANEHIVLRIAAAPLAAAEVHADRAAGAGVAGGDNAAAAVQGVGTRAARQQVVAGLAAQAVGLGVSRELVVQRRALQVLNAAVAVTRRLGGVAAAVGQAGHDGRLRPQVAGGVLTAAALQSVGTQAALQGVVAHAAIKQVGTAVAHQGVGVLRTAQAFHTQVLVACGVAAVLAGLLQTGRDSPIGAGVAGCIKAVATVQGVRACTALQHVVAFGADQAIGVDIAGQLVCPQAAAHVLDAVKGVALGIAAAAAARGQVHDDGLAGGSVAGGIAAIAPHQTIGALTTL